MKSLPILLILAAVPAHAQMAQWNSFHQPGSPYTNYTGPDGQSATTFHSPGSPYSNTDINGPNGQQQHCTTYHSPGSMYANTTCY